MKRTALTKASPDWFSAAGVIASVLLGLALASPARGAAILVVVALAVVLLTLLLPAHLFLGAVMTVLASSSAFEQSFITVGSAKVYTVDLVIPLVLFRASLPRARQSPQLRILEGGVALPIALCGIVMIVAGIRGSLGENSLGAIARLETPLIYFPLAYVGFTRILRETSVSLPRVVRTLAVTGLAFIGYAVFARATHQRFGDPSGSGIGGVQTTEGVFRRDYGFFSAFELYALLALGGLSFLMFSRRASLNATLVTVIAFAATALTLIRGLIFGVVAGALWLVVLALRTRWQVRLASRLVPLIATFTVVATAFFVLSPTVARGVAERFLPGVFAQAEGATKNTEYRIEALKAGEEVALDAPFGLGFVGPESLDAAGFPSIYIPHSQWGSLLVFTGWVGVLLLGWAGVAVLRRSSRLPAAAPWLHPLLTATAFLVLIQGSGWNVLFSQTWSLGMIALVLALRFGLNPGSEQAASEVARDAPNALPSRAISQGDRGI
jgi:hypothetical protein